jgi:hypothetical protein
VTAEGEGEGGRTYGGEASFVADRDCGGVAVGDQVDDLVVASGGGDHQRSIAIRIAREALVLMTSFDEKSLMGDSVIAESVSSAEKRKKKEKREPFEPRCLHA